MSLTVYADPVSDKVRELVSLLHMASSDVIFCAFSDSEDVNLIKKILLQLAKGIFFYELYNRGNTNLASEIASMTSEDSDFKVIEKYERRTGNSKIVISVFNLERFLDTESVDELNLYRDLFLRIGYPVLIWIPEKSISHLVEEAPDFWRIRTKVFYFQEAEVLNRKGKDLVDMQKCEEALEYFDKALENDPKNIDTLKNKGLTLYNLGKRQEAIACYNKALETDSTRADILYNKAKCLYHLMSYDEATKCLDRASKIEPNDPWIRLLKSLSEAKLNSGITLNKVAYVGLSGPLLYDYKNSLTERLPNPVLEGPMGLVALYDEIVFLNEAVCPKNMKELEFVKLLSDSDDIWDYFERLNIEKIRKQIEIAWKQIEFPYKKLRPIAEKIAPFATWDNHSRPMDLGSRYIQLTPDSSSISNVVYDNIISRDKDMALITNSLISETIIDVLIKGDSLSHKLDLVRDLPNFVTENGPDLEIIYEIRNGDFAKRVRRNKQWNSLNKVIFDSNFSTASTPINASTGNLPQRYFFFSPEILPTEYSQVSY